MTKWIGTLAFGAVMALAASACQDGVGNTDLVDEAALRADVALVAADAMFEDLSLMQEPPVLALMAAGPELAGAEGGGTGTKAKQVTFFDQDGKVQDSYDRLATASMAVVWDFTRAAEQTFWSASVTRHREMTITGLLGEEAEHTWNGTGNGVVARSRHPEGGVVRTYDMTSDVVIADVVKGLPRADNPYPKSGTITRHIKAVVSKDGTVVGERDLTATITFNGSQFATVTVGADTWQVDLSQGGLRGIFRKKG